MATINPFDFFVEDAAAQWPFAYEPVLAHELKPYLEPLPGTPLVDRYVETIAERGRDRRFRHRPQSQAEPGHRLPGAHGARRADAGRDAGACLGLVPRQRLAARADPAAGRSRCTVRVRLSHPAAARHQSQQRSRRRSRRLHRSACVGRSLHSWRGLDRARSDVGPARRRGAYSAGSDAVADQRRAHYGHARRGRGRFLGQHAGRAHPRNAARDEALQRRAVAGDPGRRHRRRSAADRR